MTRKRVDSLDAAVGLWNGGRIVEADTISAPVCEVATRPAVRPQFKTLRPNTETFAVVLRASYTTTAKK